MTIGFQLLDKQGLVMTSGVLQPAVIIQLGTNTKARKSTPGKPASQTTKDGSFTIDYSGVSGDGKLSVTWRFEAEAFWLDPIVYESSEPKNVVALHYFAQGTGEDAQPTLDNYYLILLGISESPGVSPIVTSDLSLNLTSCLKTTKEWWSFSTKLKDPRCTPISVSSSPSSKLGKPT
jgi:hypothetical protein